MKKYEPKVIEPKWQKIWQETNLYTADLESDKPKYIAMSMFNYPSGAGLHVGHAMNFTISDVKARFKRQQGYESYHPVGWDSFGLPAENYAIKVGVSPQESMATIIPNYHKQYQAMGWSNDWEKEIATHTPEYYKWTQWIFSQMHRNKFAYQDARMQWWCNQCQTVLANEQVTSDNKCWRHEGKDDPVIEKKEVKQWFFKITDYADELLEATDELDWTESVKLAQKNWIGRSEGIDIDYQIDGSDNKLTCFTTTPVNYGLSFIVIAPEHPMVDELTLENNKSAVKAYVENSLRRTELERQSNKEKTGVFTGSYAINHLTGDKFPVWVADFVLAGFGTGAVQGCPAHDERDFEFAVKYKLPIIRVVEGPDGNTNREVDPSKEDVEQVKLNHGINRKMINSGQFNGMIFDDAMQKTMDYFEENGWGKRIVNYKMRDWSVSRQRYWGAPIPIINCSQCGPVLVPDSDLPVVLPELTDFAPSGDGRSALARAKDWLKVSCPECGGEGERETDTLDTYICSSWYMFRFLDPHNQEKIFNSEIANKWMPIDFYNGGDHATAHLLYARFVTRFFHKLGLVDKPEPFKQMLFNGKVTAHDGAAFSKTLGNGPDPLEIINSGYGADALRIYIMFAAPLELGARWDAQGVPGAYRFLNRLWNLTQEYLEAGEAKLNDGEVKKLLIVANKTTKKVSEDLEKSLYNTAIASCMAALNDLTKLKAEIAFGKNGAWTEAIETILMCIAPFAPHITDELWQQLGHSDSINKNHWPELDENYLQEDEITIALMVNGKLRAELKLNKDVDKAEMEKAALANPRIQEFLSGKEPKKVIVVPGKLVNFVV
jgi:leucyl-tRNA synthetase